MNKIIIDHNSTSAFSIAQRIATLPVKRAKHYAFLLAAKALTIAKNRSSSQLQWCEQIIEGETIDKEIQKAIHELSQVYTKEECKALGENSIPHYILHSTYTN